MAKTGNPRPGNPFGAAAIALAACGLILAAAWSAPAAIAAATSLDARHARAQALCQKGDHAQGVRIFSELFQETGKPLLLRSQGRCYELNNKYPLAINRFKAYLASGDTTMKAEVEQRIHQLVAAGDRAAERACLTGDYQSGAQLLVDLYIETRKPTFLHNQARCYDQNGIYDRAAQAFSEFLRIGNPAPKTRASIEQRLRAIDASLLPRTATTGAPSAASAAPATPGRAPASVPGDRRR